jgi:hypothetical protein
MLEQVKQDYADLCSKYGQCLAEADALKTRVTELRKQLVSLLEVTDENSND